MESQRLALLIIAARKWRNGHLQELTQKALRGDPLDRELDSDMSKEEWARATAWEGYGEGPTTIWKGSKPPQQRPANSSVTKPERIKHKAL